MNNVIFQARTVTGKEVTLEVDFGDPVSEADVEREFVGWLSKHNFDKQTASWKKAEPCSPN